MSQVGPAGREVIARKAKLYAPSGTLIAVAKVWSSRFGYELAVEPVCGSDYPRVMAATFRGEFEMEGLMTTDHDVRTYVTLGSNNELPTFTIQWEEFDAMSTPNKIRWTNKVKFSQVEMTGPPSAEGFRRFRARGIIVDEFPSREVNPV